MARTLLRPEPAARVVLEVLHHEGAAPRQGTVAHLAQVLRDVTGKPVAVQSSVLPGGGGRVSADEVRALADRHGQAVQGGGQVAVRVLFLDGELAGEESVLGAAVRADTAVVFGEKVRSSSSLLVPSTALEVAVATHELGHLLGLVDLALDTGRADPEHPGHSPNRGSVMYWAVESDLVSSILSGPPPRDFDGDDRADLARMRAGA